VHYHCLNCRYYTVSVCLSSAMIMWYNYFELYYVDSCPLVPMDIGVTEKRQLYYYMANWTRVHHYLPTTVHHALTTKVTHTHHCAIFTLTDTRLALQHQLGGANLRTVVSTLTHLYACPYVDHFNGSYDVICPLLDHKPLSQRHYHTNVSGLWSVQTGRCHDQYNHLLYTVVR
jgi:hypothetical protein